MSRLSFERELEIRAMSRDAWSDELLDEVVALRQDYIRSLDFFSSKLQEQQNLWAAHVDLLKAALGHNTDGKNSN